MLDRGLGAALSALAETSTTPASLQVSIRDRPSPAIEAIAYFCAAELLANVAKHSGASAAAIRASRLLPDVAIIDVRMPPTHTDEGLRAAQLIHRDHPGVGVLVFSQYIETRSAAELFAAAPAGVGYLLKDRVADVSDFIDAITRVARGGTVLDPEVVRQLLGASRRASSLATLTPREQEVLALMAQGRSNAAIATSLTISAGVVEKHVASIFARLGLAPSGNDNRRVIAAIRYLES